MENNRMTREVISKPGALNGAFLKEYNSTESIRRYLRGTAGYGISYLLDHDYGSLYLEIATRYVSKSRRMEGIRLWEFGCGGGMNLIHLVREMESRGIVVECAYGTDFSEEMIKAAIREAKACLTEVQNGKVHFCVARNECLIEDLTKGLGIKKEVLLGSFDIMVGVNTIRYCHRLRNQNDCVGDIVNLLREGGVCIVIDMNNKFPAFRSRFRKRRLKEDRAYYLPALDEYALPFSSAGLEIVKKENFCWVPHSAGRPLTVIMRALTPVLGALVPSHAMRSLIVSRKGNNHHA